MAGVDPNELVSEVGQEVARLPAVANAVDMARAAEKKVSLTEAAEKAAAEKAAAEKAAREKTASLTRAPEKTASLTPSFRSDRDVMLDAGHARGRAMLKEIASSMSWEDMVADGR